jgi:hypothetical protein
MEINDKEDKITSVKEISQEEFNNTSENGFEIIHNEDKTTGHDITKNLLVETNHGNAPVNTQHVTHEKFPEPTVHTNIEKKITTVEHSSDSSDDVMYRVNSALVDTTLPSKSPLPEEDPFRYLTSRNYLKYFVVASTAVLFVLTLLD